MVARALLYAEVQARTYRRVWKASTFSNFVNPILFLAAMGLGLGSLVDRSAPAGPLDGATYLAFLAPGLMAATAMTTGAGEGSFPVMAGIKWVKTYHAALATPLSVTNLVAGHLIWVTVRLLMVVTAFTLVSAAFGAVPLGAGLVAMLPAALTGLAFAAATTAFAGALETEMGLTLLFRFGITPLFLFSGTFFPIEQLPGWMQPAAYIVPLWHGVQLTRNLALDLPFAVPPAVHVLYLLVWVAAGARLAVHYLTLRLRP